MRWSIALLTWFFLTGFLQKAFSQSTHIELLANKNDYPTAYYNDVWGFVDSGGVEYAVLGVQTGIAIYSLENPATPVLRKFIPGVRSVWRDIKSYAGFLYAIADQGREGLLVVDMRKAPTTITWNFYQPVIQSIPLLKAHNLYIDEKGRLCLSGSNLNNGGVLLFDVATEPGSPHFLGFGPNRYSHDCYARGDTLWSADVYDGEFSVVDIQNPGSPVLMATYPTGRQFTHNVWLSADGKTLFTTDEVTLGQVEAYDVSNLEDIQKTDGYIPRSAKMTAAIPHNVHVYNGFLVTSWYTEGLVVVDAHNPEILVETERYATYKGKHTGFYGCWGAFPFLPSGLVLASDIETGLYVLRPTYQRAAYAEGIITDKDTGMPVAGVRVASAGTDFTALADEKGYFRGGVAAEKRDLLFLSADGYLSDTIGFSWMPGVMQSIHVQLRKESVTSTEETVQESRALFSISPNPAQEFVRISFLESLIETGGRLVVRDMAGRIHQLIEVAKGQAFTDLQLEPGMYIVGWLRPGNVPYMQPVIIHP